MSNHEDIVRANSVIGEKVKNKDKENLGEIEEIMLDKYSGEVEYVVLSFGGILGMGEKLFALPWKSISYSPKDKAFILDMSKETLEKAPGFDKNNWPDMADPAWKQTIGSYYGVYEKFKEEAKNKTKGIAEKIKNANVQEGIEKTGEEIKKSGKDWWSYLQSHPLQTILFGVIGYFAFKGVVKD